VETEELCEQTEAIVTCSDGSSAATQAECPPVPTAAQEQLQTCQDGSVVSFDEACSIPPDLQLQTCTDGSDVAAGEDCSLPECDGSFQDCITQDGNFCEAGSDTHGCECSDDMSDCPNYPSQEQKEC
jgi:hypothetical protein